MAKESGLMFIGRTAGSSALALANVLQNAILRYSRLPICATLNRYDAGSTPGFIRAHAEPGFRAWFRIRFPVAADVRRLKFSSEMHGIDFKSEPPHVGCYDY